MNDLNEKESNEPENGCLILALVIPFMAAAMFLLKDYIF